MNTRGPQVGAFHELSRSQVVVLTVGVMLALLLTALDQTVVGTAMPRIIAELNGLDYYAWVTTAYLVASTAVVPIAGKLGDLFGRRWFLIGGMVGFVAASALCGLSQDMLQLVAFRGLQGLFGGVLMANVFTVIADIYPPQTRAKIQGIFGAIFGLASIVGPTVGGYFTDNLGWRWVFYVNLPVGVLAVAVVLVAMPLIRSEASWRDIDLIGSLTIVAAIVPLLIALSISRDHDWGSPEMLALLAVAAVMAGAFVLEERRAAQPIVPLGLFRDPTFSVSVVVVFLVAAGMFGSILFVPLIFQGVLGISATSSGQLLTPMMFAMILTSVATGQLITRVKRYRYVGTFGMLAMALGMYLLAQVGPATPEIDVVRDIMLIGVGLGTSMPLYNNAVMSAVPREVVGVATSQIQFWRSMGGTVGVAMLGSVLAHRLPERIALQVATLDLPPQATALINTQGAGAAQSLFDPVGLAATRAALPPQAQPVFDQVFGAIKLALASTTHDIFMYGVAIVLVAAVVSVFLKDVPIRGRTHRPTEAPPAATPAFSE